MRIRFLNTMAPIALVAGVLAAMPAHAAKEPQLNASIYAGPGEVNDVDTKTYGGRLGVVFESGFLVAGSYEQTDPEKTSKNLDEIRFGIGAIGTFGAKRRVRLYAQADYVDLKADDDFSDDRDGFAALVGVNGRMPANLRAYARAGYLKLDDQLDGFEYLIGLAFEKPKGFWSIFTEYRGVRLDEHGDELDLDSIRLGVGLSF